MKIMRAGSRPTQAGSAVYFQGSVLITPVMEEPDRVRALIVAFAPGARTSWHTHPLGQALYVLSGIGRVQREGEGVREIHPGDTVWISPGEKHWHGAAPDTAMKHMAFQEQLDGLSVTWLEPVTEEDYCAPLAS